MSKLKTFYYKDELYVRLVPSKMLFRSTMIHEVVNRGDVFAMRVSDQHFTVIPGTAQVDHTEHRMSLVAPVQTELHHV